jgi:hypothetical protein
MVRVSPLLLLLLLLAASLCRAQDVIHHCVAANGTPVYTDQPCPSMDARSAGAVHARSHHDCPATRKALRTRVADAFDTHNANALAGLMLWHGFSGREAVRRIRWFRKLMRRPLLDVVDGDTPYPPVPAYPATSSTSAEPVPEADMRIALGGAGTAGTAPLGFAVADRAGCLWLRP